MLRGWQGEESVILGHKLYIESYEKKSHHHMNAVERVCHIPHSINKTRSVSAYPHPSTLSQLLILFFIRDVSTRLRRSSAHGMLKLNTGAILRVGTHSPGMHLCGAEVINGGTLLPSMMLVVLVHGAWEPSDPTRRVSSVLSLCFGSGPSLCQRVYHSASEWRTQGTWRLHRK